MVELRRHQRAPIDVTVDFIAKDSTERVPARATDLSLGGMYLHETRPLGFSAELTVHVTLPGQKTPLALPGIVRWTRANGMGVQFGLMGARETHAITEFLAKSR